jgi:hypothetical protein
MNKATLLLFYLSFVTTSIFGQTDIYQSKYNSAIYQFTEGLEASEIVSFSALQGNTIPEHLKNEIKNELEFLNPSTIFSQKEALIKNILSLPSFELDTGKIRNRPLNFLHDDVKRSGMVEVESFTSNKVLPYSLNERQYIRLYATPSISILGLPFESNIYYTTEENSYFNTNSVSLNFNIDKFRENLKDKSVETVDDKKKQIYSIMDYQTDLDNYIGDINRQITTYQKEVEATKSSQINALNSSLDTSNMRNEIINRAKDSASNRLSTPNFNEQDSLLAKRKDATDSLEMRRAQIDYKIQQLQKYVQLADSLKIKASSANTILSKAVEAEKIQMIKDANKTKTKKRDVFLDSSRVTKRVSDLIKTVEEFEIGLFTPYYSAGTLNGIPVKGVNFKRSSTNDLMYSRFSLGISPNAYNSFSRESFNENIYSRRLIAAKYGIGTEDFDDVYLISMGIWDSESKEAPVFNTVNSAGFSKSLNKLSLNGEVAHSFNQIRDTLLILNEQPNSILKNAMYDRLSMKMEAKWKITSTSQIIGSFDQKNQNFKSLGSPFLRNDYRAIDFSVIQKTFNNKLVFSGFYKHFVGNVSKLSENTNKLSGLGAILQSNFKKRPNIIVSYTPFEQSNNHQDSLLRTNNKFRSLNAQVTNQKSIDKHLFYSVISYNLALVEYQESNFQQSNTRSISFNQLYQNDKTRASLGYTSILTFPAIDSLSSNAFHGSIDYKLRKLKIGANLQHKYTLSNGKQLSQALFIERQVLKSLTIKLSSGYRFIDGIWGLNNTGIFYGTMNVRFEL